MHATGATNFYSFAGGNEGEWRVTSVREVRGEGLQPVERLRVLYELFPDSASEARWVLRGTTSNLRYATRDESAMLRARQPAIGRVEATCAALIPIGKSEQWWELAQDERRAIFEEQSAHTAIGLEYLPAVARRLHHSRDIGEPFDFLTWFEYAPEDAEAFEALVARLRATREWTYVEREVDIRLVRASAGERA